MARTTIPLGCATITAICPTCGLPFEYPEGERHQTYCGHRCWAKTKHATPDTFWAKADKQAACWIWTRHKNPQGYGVLTYKGQFYRAHRLAWELTNGEIPKGFHVCHKCDVPSCVNPDHLFLGTALENNRDRHNKQRDAIGLKSGRHTKPERFKKLHELNKNGGGNARLTRDTVLAIRARSASGLSNKQIASEYGLCVSHVWAIVTRRCWRFI